MRLAKKMSVIRWQRQTAHLRRVDLAMSHCLVAVSYSVIRHNPTVIIGLDHNPRNPFVAFVIFIYQKVGFAVY